MENEDYIKSLETTIAKFLEPIKGIPFPIAIKALTGYEVIAFDKEAPETEELLKKLIRAAQIAGESAYIEGIFARRPNEAGNRIEPFVIEALNEVGLRAEKPETKNGKRKAVGYPDIKIDDEGRIVYLDCKTYNIEVKETTFRSFYFSPSLDPKITANAYHLVVSFQLAQEIRKGGMAFVPLAWEIYTLDKLLVQVKHEFNAGNKDLYNPEALLAKGKIGK